MPEEDHMESGGEVKEGYESISKLFLRNFRRDHNEDRAQFCAYVHGEKVVDIWASRVKQSPSSKWGAAAGEYGPSNVQNVFSSSKVITSLVVAMMVDRGYLRYDQKIVDIWPEYGEAGKHDTTVEMLMKHEAGLQRFSEDICAEDLTAENIKRGKVSSIIEKQKPRNKPGSKRVYHALTRGFIVNEVVRRVDPKGRTIGEFLREEIVKPLLEPLGYSNELCLGLPSEMHHRAAPLVKRTNSWTYRQLLLPKSFGGGKIVGANVATRALFLSVLPFLQFVEYMQVGPTIGVTPTKSHEPGRGLSTAIEFFNSPEVRKAELPSANCHASARALAAVANAIVYEGNEVLLSNSGKKIAHGNPTQSVLYFSPFFGAPMTFTNAGWCLFGYARHGYVGWMGLGGSAMQWHLEEQIAIGYCMNAYEVIPWNARAEVLQQEVLKCAKRMRRNKSIVPVEPVAELTKTMAYAKL